MPLAKSVGNAGWWRYTLIGMGFLEFLAIVVILIAGRAFEPEGVMLPGLLLYSE